MRDDSYRIHIVGAGLIGTSLGLACTSNGYKVSIEDSNKEREALARDLIHATGETHEDPDFIAVAVSPRSTASVIFESLERTSNAIVIDVASIKTKVLSQVQALSGSMYRYLPTHPIAGRELGGPGNAQGDLFEGRPWVVTPHSENTPDVVSKVRELIERVGGIATVMAPEAHDYLFARISHIPQLLSTALSSHMLSVAGDVSLAGQGLRDMTRLAGSDGKLWSEIVAMNKSEISNSFQELRSIISRIEEAIQGNDLSQIERIFLEGNEGRNLFAGKHGGKAREYVFFRIVIEDKPGVLSELFKLCGDHGVNVEDLQIEHTPNQETGLITIAVLPDQRDTLSSVLSDHHWKFYIEDQTQ